MIGRRAFLGTVIGAAATVTFRLSPVYAALPDHMRPAPEVAKALGREMTWEKDDLALQNIQARVRSPGVWMMANTRQALLLATLVLLPLT